MCIMYLNNILNHNNLLEKNTIMETILKNIKDLRNEFSVSNYRENGAVYSYTGADTVKVADSNIDTIKALQKRYQQYLAETINSKENSTTKAALSPTPEDNCSYYTNELDTRNQYDTWLSKFHQIHRESQDSGHSSPDDSRSPSPSSYSRIAKSQSPTPPSSVDGGIDMGIEEVIEEEDRNNFRAKSPAVDNEWQMVASKAKTGPKTPILPFCPERSLCNKGSKCKAKHTQREKELFEARKTAKAANDKEFSDTKFRTELCNKVNVPHNRKMCRFAHGIEQLVCKLCYDVGHKRELCPRLKENQQQPESNSPVSPVRGQ